MEQDESWFLRFRQPNAYMWMDAQQPLRLIQRTAPRGTRDKAISCFGAWCEELDEVFLDFAQGYPNSEQMWSFIIKLLTLTRQLKREVLVLIWDNAPWHTSKRIKQWIRWYNQCAKLTGDVRLLVFWLPTKSPWLNPIEPRWGHAKKHVQDRSRVLQCKGAHYPEDTVNFAKDQLRSCNVCEPSGELATPELKRRICTYFQTQPLSYMMQP